MSPLPGLFDEMTAFQGLTPLAKNMPPLPGLARPGYAGQQILIWE
jgi:hypothetical protein